MKPLLFVDGYNVIFAWKSLTALAKESLEHARDKLVDTMANFGKFKGYVVVVVFDAMNTDDSEKTHFIGKDFLVIFTDREETADSRIEKMVYAHRNERRQIYVATSDGPEQNQILGTGACRIPARELERDVIDAKKEQLAYDHKHVVNGVRNEMSGQVRADVLLKLEEIRRKK
jgi:predicted RNA-binding protein with PIN domain